MDAGPADSDAGNEMSAEPVEQLQGPMPTAAAPDLEHKLELTRTDEAEVVRVIITDEHGAPADPDDA